MEEQRLPERRLRASDAERDQFLTVVQHAYEAGRLDLGELKDRQDVVLRAVYRDELHGVIDDLPEGQELTLAEDSALPATQPAPAGLPETAPADGGFTLSVLSGRDVLVESGTRRLHNFAWWGGNKFDLTAAMGPGRIVTLVLDAIMAGSDIIVPEGVRVVDQSVAIMAGNEIDRDAQGDGSNGTLVLKGFLWWAGNDVVLESDQRRSRRR